MKNETVTFNFHGTFLMGWRLRQGRSVGVTPAPLDRRTGAATRQHGQSLWSPTGRARGTDTPAPMGATSRPPIGGCTTMPPTAEGRGAMVGLIIFATAATQVVPTSRREAQVVG